MNTKTDNRNFRDRETKHVYACARCGSDVRLACNLVPDEHGSKRNDGFLLACGCLSVSGEEIANPDALPADWIPDMDFEIAHSESDSRSAIGSNSEAER